MAILTRFCTYLEHEETKDGDADEVQLDGHQMEQVDVCALRSPPLRRVLT